MNSDKAFAAPAINTIKQRWPEIWEQLEQSHPCQDIQFVQDKPNATFIYDKIQLASAYNPASEAELQISLVPPNPEKLQLYGVGMGYLPRVLLQNFHSLRFLQVFILNKSLFLELLYWIDQTDWLADERLALHLPSNNSRPISPWVVTPPLLWLADKEAANLRDRLLTDMNSENITADQQNRRQMLMKNIEDNTSFVEKDGNVTELFDTLSGTEIEVIVVGAGPSLDKLISVISDRQKNGTLVIAVDAATKPLLFSNILPDIIVTIDPLRNGILPNFDGDLSALSNCKLIYYPVVHHDVLQIWPFTRLTAFADHTLYKQLGRQHSKGVLYSSGSVIHPAIDLAVKMGTQKIALAGADFSFPYAKTHADGVPHGQAIPSPNEQIPSRRWVFNGNEKRVATQLNMIGYLRDLEDYIKLHDQIEFVNLSKDGARIEGTVYPAEAQDEH